MKKPEFKTRVGRFLPSAGLLWALVIFCRYNIYYKGFLTPTTEKTLLAFAAAYSLVGLVVYLSIPIKKLPIGKSYIAYKFFRRVVPQLKNFHKDFIDGTLRKHFKPSREERTAVLLLLVKLFFLPLMINFLFGNFDSLTGNLRVTHWSAATFSISGFNSLLFPMLFNAILLVDTAIFAFGYMFEASWLRSKVRSVDPTYFGWIVCLASYPPFNNIVSSYTSWYANNDNFFHSVYWTFLMRLAVIGLMSVYVWASIALGTKASNLTNRGIVVTGPYRYFRHPAYVSKNLAWWVTILPVLSLPAVLSMAAWSFVYYLRAITEERHLAMDPDYRQYCRSVPYRFVPRASFWTMKKTAKETA